MTSLAFILDVLPLVLAKGAGASARASIGIAVFSGMLASTCLAVLFAPPFFVIPQRRQEGRSARKAAAPAPPAACAPAQPLAVEGVSVRGGMAGRFPGATRSA